VVVGGAGKTPTTIAICDLLREKLHTPHVVASGYGGYIKNVVRVDSAMHAYLQVGDEALLLANAAPTWIGKNKVYACRAAISAGASVIIMDDGLQNNAVAKTLKILVIDSMQGFGNGKLIPAGPLRETVEAGSRNADVALIIGEKNEVIENRIRSVNGNKEIYHARTEATELASEDEKNVIGFCGLGYPEKFKATLEQSGYRVMDFIAFRDHHAYTITEIQRLIATAKRAGGRLVTTWKDYVKIPSVFKNDIKAINVKLIIEEDEFGQVIMKALGSSRLI
jgi:tetraacyldisaccharide 4'-kinase